MDNHGSPWRISRPQTNQSYVGKFRGYEHASHPSIYYQIGTNRILILKSIILKGQNMVLTYPRGGLRGKYLKKYIYLFLFFGSFLVSNSMKMMDFG